MSNQDNEPGRVLWPALPSKPPEPPAPWPTAANVAPLSAANEAIRVVDDAGTTIGWFNALDATTWIGRGPTPDRLYSIGERFFLKPRLPGTNYVLDAREIDARAAVDWLLSAGHLPPDELREHAERLRIIAGKPSD